VIHVSLGRAPSACYIVQEAALREEAAQAAAGAATKAAAAHAELRTRCERIVAEERQQMTARLEDSERRHGARLAQVEQEAMRKVELLQAAHMEAQAAARQEALDQQVRPLMLYGIHLGKMKHCELVRHMFLGSARHKLAVCPTQNSVLVRGDPECKKSVASLLRLGQALLGARLREQAASDAAATAEEHARHIAEVTAQFSAEASELRSEAALTQRRYGLLHVQ